MTLQPPAYKGVSWYVKFGFGNVRCAYIDLDSYPDFKKFSLQYLIDLAEYDIPGGITYNQQGITEQNQMTLVPDHFIIGWDYGHDYYVVFGLKNPPSLAEIENDAKHIIDNLLKKVIDNVDIRYES